MTTLERVRLAIVEEAPVFLSEILPATSLDEIADDESMALISLFAWLENRFDVAFGDATDWIVTDQDVADFIDGKRQETRLLRPVGFSRASDSEVLLRPVDHRSAEPRE